MSLFRLQHRRVIDRTRLVTRVHKDRIVFLNYPFPPASVFPDGFLRAGQIRDIDPVVVPAEIRLKTGEILLAWNVHGAELESFARENRVPLVQRRNNWRDLLEPCLDAEISQGEEQAAVRRLEKQGFTRDEINKIRKKIQRAMLSYNSHAWEENHLGLWEVLEAVYRVSFAWKFKRFYHDAMRIANRGTKTTL